MVFYEKNDKKPTCFFITKYTTLKPIPICLIVCKFTKLA